jgi:hypothetical protein
MKLAGNTIRAFDGSQNLVCGLGPLKGFGFLLCTSMKVRMSASSCLTDVWTPSLDLLSGEFGEPALDLIDP